MSISLVLPGIAVVAIAVVAGLPRWSVTPRTAMRMLTAVAAMTAVTVLIVVFTAAAGFIGSAGIGLSFLEQCARLSPHHQVGVVGDKAFHRLESVGALQVRSVVPDASAHLDTETVRGGGEPGALPELGSGMAP